MRVYYAEGVLYEMCFGKILMWKFTTHNGCQVMAKAHLSFCPYELKTVALSIINSKCLEYIQAAQIINVCYM
jgi:hypothetical protein